MANVVRSMHGFNQHVPFRNISRGTGRVVLRFRDLYCYCIELLGKLKIRSVFRLLFRWAFILVLVRRPFETGGGRALLPLRTIVLRRR